MNSADGSTGSVEYDIEVHIDQGSSTPCFVCPDEDAVFVYYVEGKCMCTGPMPPIWVCESCDEDLQDAIEEDRVMRCIYCGETGRFSEYMKVRQPL